MEIVNTKDLLMLQQSETLMRIGELLARYVRENDLQDSFLLFATTQDGFQIEQDDANMAEVLEVAEHNFSVTGDRARDAADAIQAATAIRNMMRGGDGSLPDIVAVGRTDDGDWAGQGFRSEVTGEPCNDPTCIVHGPRQSDN